MTGYIPVELVEGLRKKWEPTHHDGDTGDQEAIYEQLGVLISQTLPSPTPNEYAEAALECENQADWCDECNYAMHDNKSTNVSGPAVALRKAAELLRAAAIPMQPSSEGEYQPASLEAWINWLETALSEAVRVGELELAPSDGKNWVRNRRVDGTCKYSAAPMLAKWMRKNNPSQDRSSKTEVEG